MKQKLFIFAFTVLSTMLFSQAQNTAFEDFKTNDGTQNFFYKNIVKTDASGNIYTLGATTTSNSTTDIYLSKKNSSGVTLWTKQINGSANYHDFGAGMVITSGGDVYITGAITNNTTTLLPDLILRKYNSSGTQQFSTTYSSGYGDVGKDIVIDASGNSYVTGASGSSGFSPDILLISFNSSGTQRWVNFFDYNGLNDGGVKIAIKGSNVAITGAITVSANNYKIATLSAVASTGILSETVTLGSTMTSSVEIVTGMTTDASGNIYICGATEVSGQGFDMYLAKLTSSLTLAWQQTYNGSSNLDDQAKGIQVDASGNVYVTGYSTSSTLGKEIRTIKYNSSGTLQWNNVENSASNGSDQAYDMEMDASSNLYVCGTMVSSNSDGLNYYTVKYNSSGTKIWETQSDGNHLNDQATNLALDSLNNVIVTGESETSPGIYSYLTVRYTQFDVVPFTDLNSEPINPKSLYLPNKGQLLNTSLSNETDILFYNLNNYPESYIARNRLSFLQFHRDTLVSTTDSLERIDLKFNNCNTSGKIYKEDAGSVDNYNFFVGGITVSDIHAYNKIIAPEIYTGIDLHYYSNAYGVKAYFVVKPSADPKQISILLQGQQSATITSNNLKINGLLGNFSLRKPNVYNSNGGTNTAATGTVGWAISGSTVSINTGTYNTSQPLVIEFSNTNEKTVAGQSSASASDNLDLCTYYGNTANDGFKRMAVDKSNNKYMAGTSDGNNYPITSGVFASTNVGATAVVLTKFDHLNQLRHSTYYGGTASASGYATCELRGLAVDSLQNIFFTGRTSCSNFPFPPSQPTGSYHYTTNLVTAGACFMSFVIKLDSAMKNNLWGTHIGNSIHSCLNDVMVDKNQNVTVGGYCYSSGTTFNFPTPPTGAYYNTHGIGLLFRFNNNGVAQYATRMSNWVTRIAEQKTNGDYFVATQIYSADSGQVYKNPGGGAYYDSLVYLHDYYIARFNNQDKITWATVFGNIHNEQVYDMAVRDSTLILVGTVDGIGFPIKYAPGQYVDSIHTNIGPIDQDLGLVRFNSYTGKWIYSSYYGGQEAPSGGIDRDEYPTSVVIDANGNYFISGNTSSDVASGFNLKSASGFYYSGTYYGNNSGFLLSYTANNDLRLSSYFGGRPYQGTNGYGTDDTYMSDMEISNGALFVAGQTNANRYFPIYDASGGVAYFDSVLTSPLTTQAYTDGFIASFTNLAFVGVHNIDKNEVFGEVLVYPNPSSGLYTIEMSGILTDKNIIFNVYNVMGQIVYKDEAKAHDGFISKQINLSNLNQGVYFINIIQDNKSLTAKVIKQ